MRRSSASAVAVTVAERGWSVISATSPMKLPAPMRAISTRGGPSADTLTSPSTIT